MKRTAEEKNGMIAALFLFQYSLLIPLMKLYSPTILIAVSGAALMIATIFVNCRVIFNIKAFIVVFCIVSLMLIKWWVDDTNPMVIPGFLSIALPPMFVFSYRFDTDSFLSSCRTLSVLNFLILAPLPMLGIKIAYMRFGYGMILTVLFSYLAVFRDRRSGPATRHYKLIKFINILIFSVSLVESVVYGNRGILVVVATFIVIDVLMIYRKKVIRNIVMALAGILVLLNLENILGMFVRLTERYGIRSYAVRKFQYQLQYGLEQASSGRNKLYSAAIETMKQHPLLGAQMVTYNDGTLYVHNLFLQLGRDMGVVVMAIAAVFIIYCLWLFISPKIDTDKKTVIAVIFCISAVRLMISSSLWERPEFWALLCVSLNHKTLLTKLRKNGSRDTARAA